MEGKNERKNTVRFVIPFPVQPKQRPRRGRGGHFYTPRETADCERDIAKLATAARNAAGVSGPFSGGLAVEAAFAGGRRADLDNLQKTLGDALNGILFHDDRQIVEWFVYRVEGAESAITVTEVSSDDPSAERSRAGRSRRNRRKS